MRLLTTRRVAALATGALAATAVTVLAGAAPASAAAPALTWQVSQQFTDHLSTHVLADGATESGGVVTFPDGVGSVDPETGAGTVQYDGSVAGSFALAGTTYYTITIADPAVTVDADGEGTLTALVSASNAAAMGNPADSTEPARVTVTTFDAAGGFGAGSLTATPDWAGVLPSGAESAALGIPEGKPVDGQSFAPEFLGQLTSGTRAHFYASGASSDPKKAPAALTAQAGAAQSVSTATTYGAAGVTFAVEGSGFTATDGNPGDDGVYIGLAPAGGMPDVDDMDDMDNFAAANWVSGSAIADGSFASSMTAAGKDLRPGVAYAVYTWRAHGHSTTSQDTETPVTISWSKLKLTLKASWSKKPTKKKAGALVVTGTGTNGKPVGDVTVTLTKGAKKIALKPVATKAGKSKVTVPKLKKGSWKVAVSYAGANYTNAKKSLTLTIK